jgi:hypothetical protein
VTDPPRLGWARLKGERDWKQYEQQIFERLKEMAGEDAEVEFDARMPGRFSGVDRQVDVFVRGDFAGRVTRATMAVDCKCFTRQVDVKHVEGVIGLVEDVGTDFGLLVTTEGFTPAAKSRADHARGMRIDIVPYEELSEWEPPFQFCDVCTDWERDRVGGVYIDPFVQGHEPPGAELAVGAGRCDRCQTIYMKCSCGTVNRAVEAEERQWLECEGGCGVEWRAEVEYDRKGIPLTEDPHEQVEFRRT